MSAPPPVDVLDSGPEPVRWRARWAAWPRWVRVAVATSAVALLLGAGLVRYLDWSAERERARRVVLTTSLAVFSSSTSPPGGAVGYFLVVRNDGPRPVSVTGVAGETAGLSLRFDGARRLDPGTEHAIPLSVRLTCPVRSGARGGANELPVDIRLRRSDGGTTGRRVELQPAAPLLDAASTLCAVRPDLRDEELSGPVLRSERQAAAARDRAGPTARCTRGITGR